MKIKDKIFYSENHQFIGITPRYSGRENKMKMNLHRAQELIEPLRKGTSEGISEHWRERLIEALEYVIEHESEAFIGCTCPLIDDHTMGINPLCAVHGELASR